MTGIKAVLFVNKKNQKNFVLLGALARPWIGPQEQKFFASFL
jgi:hypothetical protein